MVNTKEKAPAEKVIKLHWDFSKWNGRDYLETWLDIGSELQDFVAERIREDVLAGGTGQQADDPAELTTDRHRWKVSAEHLKRRPGRIFHLGSRKIVHICNRKIRH